MIYIQDISPSWANTDVSEDGQSVTGRMLSLAVGHDNLTLYAGTYSNLWRSADGGKNFGQLMRPQPQPDEFDVPGALGGWGAFDVAVSPTHLNVVLAFTRYNLKGKDRGLYRSLDGGATWKLVHQFPDPQDTEQEAGQIVWAPDDPNWVFAAGGTSIAISKDGGATFADVRPWDPADMRGYHLAVPSGFAAAPDRRFVYALGKDMPPGSSRNGVMWVSRDGGATWKRDLSPSVPKASGSPTTAFQGNAPSIMALHPSRPQRLYVLGDDGKLWLVDYSLFFDSNQIGVWAELPTPQFADGELDSGNRFLAVSGDLSNPLLFFCAKSRLYVTSAPPSSAQDWHRLDPDQTVHVDLHGVFPSHDFNATIDSQGYHFHSGTLWLLSDGGLDRSTDGGMHFEHPHGLSTLSTVNICGVAKQGQTALCLNTGDNWGFYSMDGGASWKTQDYKGGDNDCSYADPLQSDRMLVFTPRNGDDGSVTLYAADGDDLPDGTDGTNEANQITGPPKLTLVGSTPRDHWNAKSSYALRGFRPVILTRRGEAPVDGGDYVFIRYQTDMQAVLLRTQHLPAVDSSDDWDTNARSVYDGARVFQQGPVLPSNTIKAVQASGGHASPVFYVGDPSVGTLWKWTEGMAGWFQLVPSSTPGGPTKAQRFFVDPYRPKILFVADVTGVMRSEDGGVTWTGDDLSKQLSCQGKIPFDRLEASAEGDNIVDTLLNDMQFDPDDALTRFAVGAGGAFFTVDGVSWQRLLDTSALSCRPTSCYYDAVSNPCRRALYLGLAGRGILKLSQLPWGSLQPPDPDSWSTNILIPGQKSKTTVALGVYQNLIHMVHLGDSSNQLWWSTSPDGLNWSTNVTIGNQKSKLTPALAEFQGLLYMVHNDDSSNDLWMATYDGTSWTQDHKIPDMKSKGRATLAVFDNKLHMLHLDDSSNEIWWSIYDGTSWNRADGNPGDQKIQGQLAQTTPALAAFGSELHMVHLGDSSHHLWWSAFDRNVWWSNVRIRCQLSHATPAFCAQDNLLHIVHMGDDSHDIWWSVYDGTAWTPDQTIPGQLSKAAAALSPTPDGQHLVMVHLGDSENDLWASVL